MNGLLKAMRARQLSHSMVLVAIALGSIVLIAVSSAVFDQFRVDLTESKLYTVTDGTEKVLSNLEKPITLTFYFSEDATQVSPSLRQYSQRVQRLLKEIVALADGKILLTHIDPKPFSEQEDVAELAGVQGVRIDANGTKLYMGLTVQAEGGEQELIPFLHPDRDGFLEYDVVKAIYRASQSSEPVVGVMTSLPVFGSQGGMMFMQRPSPAWTTISQLQQMVNVKTIEPTVTDLPDDLDALVIIHPKGMSERTAYVVEQYFLGGGKGLVFLDPAVHSKGLMEAVEEAEADSAFDQLLEQWGVEFTHNQYVGDFEHALRVNLRGSSSPERHPGLLGIPSVGIEHSEVATADLEALNFAFAGAISLKDIEADDDAKSQLELIPLVWSSERSGLLPVAEPEVMEDARGLLLDLEVSGERYTLGGRLQGTVTTAFESPPEGGDDAEADASTDKPLEEQIADANQKAKENDAKSEETQLQSGLLNLMVFGDADMLSDQLWVQVQNFLGTPILREFADNGALFANSVELMAGNAALVDIRSRGEFLRPFTVIDDLRRDAEDAFRLEEERLLVELDAAEQKLNELQAQKMDEQGGAVDLTAEQLQTLKDFQAEKIMIRKKLRDVRLKLNEDIDRLDFRIKLINVLIMPLMLTLVFVGITVVRRRKYNAAMEVA